MLVQRLEFDPAHDAGFFAAVPAAPAVFVLRGHGAAAEPYVSKTANLRRRLLRLLGVPEEHTRKLNLRQRVGAVEWALTGSDFESGLLLYQTLRAEFPAAYTRRWRLRPAPLIRLMMENEYPRIAITTRLATLRGRSLYYGPFPSRPAAEKFSNDALDFFKLRRCTDESKPDPAFPGCIYSEMKMCLAPCFRGCSDADYAAETARVQAFFDSGGHSLVRELGAQRDAASARLEFENAAALHARLDKLASVRSQVAEIVRRIDRLDGLLIQPAAQPESVALFRLEGGRINGPIGFAVQQKAAPPEPGSRPLSMEARLTEALAQVPPLPPAPALETMEHLAYLKRWYYRSSKIGEVFFTDQKGELPLRRVVRGLSRVLRGEPAVPDLSESARDYWINRGRAAHLNPENYNV